VSSFPHRAAAETNPIPSKSGVSASGPGVPDRYPRIGQLARIDKTAGLDQPARLEQITRQPDS
jgi:hypothetical protein